MLKRLSLKALLASIGVAGLLAVFVLGSISYWSFQRLNSGAHRTFVAKDVVADILPPPMYLIEVRLMLSRLVEGRITQDQAHKEYDRMAGEYNDRVAYWKNDPPFGLEKKLFADQHKYAKLFLASALNDVLLPLKEGDSSRLTSGMNTAHNLFVQHRKGVDATVIAGVQFGEAATDEFHYASSNGLSLMFGFGAALLALVVASFFFARKVIMGSIAQGVVVVEQVASGDLSKNVVTERTDELGAMMSAMGRMVINFRATTSEVRSASEEVSIGAAEIAQANQDLSTRTELQAANLGETASTLSQITAGIKSTTDNTRRASELARSASHSASDGGAAVARVVSTMADLQLSSEKITEIIGLIDGIAFQTNILALNAAVEAARAGEQGRGFAVVAGEVRTLAARSASAAQDVKSLIAESAELVGTGNALVSTAGTTINSLVTEMQEVSGLIDMIADSAGEQNDSVAQINATVAELDATTQQNAALVEQTAAGSASLREQTVRLQSAISSYKLEEDA